MRIQEYGHSSRMHTTGTPTAYTSGSSKQVMVTWDLQPCPPSGEHEDTIKQFRWRVVIIIISAHKIDAQKILRIAM